MCELFGVSSKTPVDIREYLRRFYSHSVNHPHGWGLMRENGGKREIIKEARCASGSRIVHSVIEKTEPQTAALAHIRLATVGRTEYNNCHPFMGTDISGREWTLIHNGTIYSGKQLIGYSERQKGNTDSERVFIYILDEVNRALKRNGRGFTREQRFDVINRTVTALSPRNKLNLMIYDGELLYVHKNMNNTLVYKKTEDGYIFSTTALESEGWKDYPTTQVNAFCAGEAVIRGKNHGHIFIPTLEYITAMDAMNI